MTKKKDETKTAPPPTDDVAPSRVTVDTVVTDPKSGMTRLVMLMKQLLPRHSGP